MTGLILTKGWRTKLVLFLEIESSPCIVTPHDVQSTEELDRELCRLFQSAAQNGVPLGPTWVCRYEDAPGLEIMVFELANSKD